MKQSDGRPRKLVLKLKPIFDQDIQMSLNGCDEFMRISEKNLRSYGIL